MGFDWENLSKMLYKMSWVTYNKDQQVEMVKEIFDQFSSLGKSALTRFQLINIMIDKLIILYNNNNYNLF